MHAVTRITALALATVTLSACVEDTSTRSEPAMRQADSNAETACRTAVNRNSGGKVGDIDVTSSEFSQANSVVMMKADGETWKCLVSSEGTVQDLSVVSR